MTKDTTENKSASKESSSKSKKSSYSKKKKGKKNILNGIAYVQSTFNNTIVSIADTNGNVISWASAGQKGFKGSRKSTPCLLYTSPSPRDKRQSRMPSSA